MSDRRNSDDIYVSTWTGSEWGTPRILNSRINTQANFETSPFVTADGQQLYFVAAGHSGGFGEWDIWVSKLQNNDWGIPVNAGPMINTQFTEFTVSLTANGKQMYFSSDKFLGGYSDIDLWVSTWGEPGWLYPLNMGPNLNSPLWEFGATLTQDKTELYFTRANFSNVPNTHDLFRASWDGSQWLPAQKLPAPGNTNALELDPSISADGQTLYFISDRQGGLGGQDVWLTSKSDSGWTEPVNPGSAINSAFKERTPFITEDGKRLYFVSDREGSFDIYYSQNNTGLWGQAIKLNSNINTDRSPGSTNNAEANEFCPVVAADGNKLHFLRWEASRNSTQLFVSTWQDTGWSPARKVGGNVSEALWIFINHDQDKLYASLSIPGGYGDVDLWVSDWQEEGVGWGPPQNLRKDINRRRTYGASVSIDGSELYYSSWDVPVPHAVDIFVSKRDAFGNWAPGVRLNINSPPDSNVVPVKAWDHYPSLSSDSKRLYFASRREGGMGDGTEDIWVAERIIDSVEEKSPVQATPKSFLLQNYPNPFNDTTVIRYVLAQDGAVAVSIYNLLGEEVITLINKQQVPGEHVAQWQGRNAKGKEVASGVYLCTLQALQIREVIKILLIR